MKNFFKISLILLLISWANISQAQQIITKVSAYTLEETLDRLKKAVEAIGMNIFAHIDHTQAASENGLQLSPTQVLIFGNPKIGTLLMQEDASVGLDLPLRILIRKEENIIYLSYHDPAYLLKEYDLAKHKKLISNMQGVMDKITDQIAKK